MWLLHTLHYNLHVHDLEHDLHEHDLHDHRHFHGAVYDNHHDISVVELFDEFEYDHQNSHIYHSNLEHEDDNHDNNDLLDAS